MTAKHITNTATSTPDHTIIVILGPMAVTAPNKMMRMGIVRHAVKILDQLQNGIQFQQNLSS